MKNINHRQLKTLCTATQDKALSAKTWDYYVFLRAVIHQLVCAMDRRRYAGAPRPGRSVAIDTEMANGLETFLQQLSLGDPRYLLDHVCRRLSSTWIGQGVSHKGRDTDLPSLSDNEPLLSLYTIERDPGSGCIQDLQLVLPRWLYKVIADNRLDLLAHPPGSNDLVDSKLERDIYRMGLALAKDAPFSVPFKALRIQTESQRPPMEFDFDLRLIIDVNDLPGFTLRQGNSTDEQSCLVIEPVAA